MLSQAVTLVSQSSNLRKIIEAQKTTDAWIWKRKVSDLNFSPRVEEYVLVIDSSSPTVSGNHKASGVWLTEFHSGSTADCSVAAYEFSRRATLVRSLYTSRLADILGRLGIQLTLQ